MCERFRARRDLERAGKDDDTSDGEWAEVQLELIRQVPSFGLDWIGSNILVEGSVQPSSSSTERW